MWTLGISGYYHDSAAALLQDGKIISAVQEERFSRKKHDARFPKNAISYCLKESGIGLKDVDYVAFYDKPFLKFERLLETYIAFAPKGFQSFRMAMPLWIKEKLFQKDLLSKELLSFDPEFNPTRLLFAEHHQSHAASAFFPSPFESALVLTMDGVGEWATTSVAQGRGNRLEILKEIHFPHSLGFLYSAFTYYTGFKVNSGEYKVMGLAPYGEPKYVDQILNNLIDVKPDGSFRLNMDYFNFCTGLTMTNQKFSDLFGKPVRRADDKLEPFHMDIAASVQKVTEDILLKITTALAKETGEKNLCLAGGVALNCVANGKILSSGVFSGLWIQPAAGDAGGALGAALTAYHTFKGQPRKANGTKDQMQGSYLGPVFTNNDVQKRLTGLGAKFQLLSDSAVIEAAAEALASEKVVGWHYGRMEFGPRSLGGRSILGDPRSPKMQKIMNLKIKYRESFRPFAPSVLREDVSNWFELDGDSPYMLIVSHVREDKRHAMSEAEQALFGIDKLNLARSEIPAVTHVDYSVRIQTVHEETNPRYHALLTRFKEKTGCGVLVNTSFNVRGEPIVCTPEDAFHCFMGTEMDFLVVENCILRKEDQDPQLKQDYKNKYELD
ncbi:MAG: carbamoyltransferase [Nitrospirota bacterium]